eukprot:scaffold5708_cov107-Isochrysis_galbana.AAC.5
MARGSRGHASAIRCPCIRSHDPHPLLPVDQDQLEANAPRCHQNSAYRLYDRLVLVCRSQLACRMRPALGDAFARRRSSPVSSGEE